MAKAHGNLQDEFSKMISELDKTVLRKMQGDAYRCSARCCDNVNGSTEEVMRCQETCSLPLKRVEAFVGNEIQNFQDRVQRCAQDCRDSIMDRVKPGASDGEMNKYKLEMESCVAKCEMKHIALLPDLLKRMKQNISTGQGS